MKKYYIAEPYREFRDHCRLNNITASDNQFIGTDRIERLHGMEFSRGQIVVIGDPRARLSFWVKLETTIRRPEK